MKLPDASKNSAIFSSTSSAAAASTTTLSNSESSVIQSTINYTNATNVSCCIGHSQNCTEVLPERVSKLNRTCMSVASVQSYDDVMNMNTAQTRDAVCGIHGASNVGNARTNSTATATPPPIIQTMKTETATENSRVARETQTTATNRSSPVNIGSEQMRFSRDRLFHASVSSTAHAFFDLFKFSRNSESSSNNNRHNHNLSRSNHGINISQKNCCAVAAMRLNVPNQDQTAVAAREPSSSNSVSTCVNHIDNSKTIVNISNAAHDGLQSLGTIQIDTTTTTTKSCPSASHIFENGTLLGAIVSPAQPSLTIQVNQNELQSQQTQVIMIELLRFVLFISIFNSIDFVDFAFILPFLS